MPDEQRPGPWRLGSTIAERYEILEQLGVGGMGVVYSCRDRDNGRLRAIKTIRRDMPADTRELVRRFMKAEADALRRIESDFVVRIFDARVDDADEAPFVVMELLPGRDLEQLVKDNGPLPASQAVTLLWQAACALKVIHAAGIVHRDLKPGNLYLKTREDGSLELKVLDFSISRLLDRANGRTTMIVGTRGFMAPEQAAGYDVDHRADIFALGQVARAILREPGAHFWTWHARATASDRRERFDSATEAIEALSAALGAPPASITPTFPGLATAATVLASPTKRRRSRLAAVGAMGVLFAAGLGLLLKRPLESAAARPAAPPPQVRGSPAAAPQSAPSVEAPAPSISRAPEKAAIARSSSQTKPLAAARPDPTPGARAGMLTEIAPQVIASGAPRTTHRPSDEF